MSGTSIEFVPISHQVPPISDQPFLRSTPGAGLPKRRQLLRDITWLGIVARVASGADYPTIWVSLFMEGILATECAPTRPERERELRGLLQLMAHPNQFAVDGADGSFEGRWRLFSRNVCVHYAIE